MVSVAIDVDKIKSLRESRNWTLAEAADAAGMKSRQQWYDVESGRRENPTIDTVQRIAQALGVKIDDLMK